MGACYDTRIINLKFKKGSEGKALADLKAYAKNNGSLADSVKETILNSITASEVLEKTILVRWEKIGEFSDKNGTIDGYSFFDASYGWLSVMEDIKRIVTPHLEKGDIELWIW